MKVSNTGPIKGTGSPSKKTKTTSGSDFASHLDKSDKSAGFTEVNETVSVASMDSILSIQEVGDSTEQENRRVMYQRGEDILDKLADIQRQILEGGISSERLQNLAQMVRARRENVEDERLIQIIDEIELRAEVEIAKWARSAKP